MNATKFGGLMPRANESVNYQYDALGRRVVRQDKKTGRTEFTHDGMDVIQDRFEKNDGTLSTTNYINGIGIDDKLKITTGTTSKYFLTDHLGSTVGMSDTNGNVTESASYDSFGRIQSSNLMTRYQYTGRETDETTGLMYYRARQYDPQIGRFTSEDPIGFEGGDINLYLYVKNQPVKLKDPSGLISPDEQMLYENEIKSMSEEREHWIKQQHILLERPCDCVERDARGYDKNALLISKFLSGDSNDPYVVGGNHPGGLNIKPNGQSYHDVVTKAYSMGFTQLPNFDSTHWGGTDYKIQMPSGQWYHITIGRPKGDWAGWTPSQPTPWTTIHCHGSDPSGFAHINDWLRLKTNGVWPF